MTQKYLIGVDLGTSATKAALYSLDGKIVVEASEDVPIYTPQPGVVEQENDDFYSSAAKTVKRCMLQSGVEARQIAGIAFDSQMAGIGAVDENFQPATRFDSWLDMRCKPYIDWIAREAGDLVTHLCGCPPTCAHGPKMLWWKNERPEEFRRIASFVTPAGYVAGRLAGLRGEQAFMDYTFIHFSGFADAQAGTWSEGLCTRFGLNREVLPRIVSPWEVIGEVKEAGAKDFGLQVGTPIAAGAGDTAANALGAGIVQPGMAFDVAGTASVLAGCTDQYCADVQHRALMTMHSVLPGLWHPLAYIAGGGLALRWLRDQLYNRCRGSAQPLEEGLYDQMISACEKIAPGSDGLIFSPHLGGRVCPAHVEMRGAWVGFSWGHTQAHFTRAVLESIAYEYAYYLQILSELLPEFQLSETRSVGGGARNRIWNQIKADVLGVPYRRLQRNEFGTWGAAMIAGRAVGVYADLAQTALEAAWPEPNVVSPDRQRHEEYKTMVSRSIRLQDHLAQYFAEINEVEA